MDAKTFIESLGGPTKVAAALDVPFTTVATWSQKNKIPHWRMSSLAELAVRQGKPVPASGSKAA